MAFESNSRTAFIQKSVRSLCPPPAPVRKLEQMHQRMDSVIDQPAPSLVVLMR